jgi:hypothetical protein
MEVRHRIGRRAFVEFARMNFQAVQATAAQHHGDPGVLLGVCPPPRSKWPSSCAIKNSSDVVNRRTLKPLLRENILMI